MENLASTDLGNVILSLSIAAGFVASGFLVLRVLFVGVNQIIRKYSKKG